MKGTYDDGRAYEEAAKTPTTCIKPFGNHPLPKFTVGILTYKRADLLRHALNSALGQEGFSDFEVIVVDDHPERGDETEQLMEEYKDCGRVAYYKHTANLGQSGNWTKLYQLARTEWVVMFHDDDMLYPDFLRNMARLIEQEPESNGYVPCNTLLLHDNSDTKPKRDSLPIKAESVWEFAQLSGNHIGAPVGMTLRRSLIEGLGGMSEECYPSNDFHFYLKFAHYHKLRLLTGYPLAVYRWSVNVSMKEETLIGQVEKDKEIFRRVYRNNSFLLPEWLYTMYLDWLGYIVLSRYKREGRISCEVARPSRLNFLAYQAVRVVMAVAKHIHKESASYAAV